jgi:hypothetical protein
MNSIPPTVRARRAIVRHVATLISCRVSEIGVFWALLGLFWKDGYQPID